MSPASSTEVFPPVQIPVASFARIDLTISNHGNELISNPHFLLKRRKQFLLKRASFDDMSGKKSKKKSQGKKPAENGSKKAKKATKSEGKPRSAKARFHVDIFTDHCMENAYYICHNVQDLLKCRGFPWPDLANKKKKGKKGK